DTTAHAAISRRQLATAIALLLCLTPAGPALAHSAETALGLKTGFLHPLTGPDHLVAMVAVGLWGAQLGSPALWILPITFPLVMALGGVIGVAGVVLPFPEWVISLSALALGLVVALRARPPHWAASVLLAVIAICHGYAHGLELPSAADPIGYGVGFITATGLLHLCGILIGVSLQWPYGDTLVRVCGAAIGCAGAFFVWSLIGAAP